MIREPWWPEHDEILRRTYTLNPAHKIATVLGRGVSAVYQRAYKLGLEKPEGWAAGCTRQRWQEGRHENSRARQFRKGEPSWSKGTKGIVGVQAGCRATQFKKGATAGAAARNWVPIGSERISKDGYLERKVTDDPSLVPARRWTGVHRLVWEQANGPVPTGHAVVFKPGRRTAEAERITEDALELVTRAELMRRNSYHNRYPKEVALLIQLRGALNRKIRNRSQAA